MTVRHIRCVNEMWKMRRKPNLRGTLALCARFCSVVLCCFYFVFVHKWCFKNRHHIVSSCLLLTHGELCQRPCHSNSTSQPYEIFEWVGEACASAQSIHSATIFSMWLILIVFDSEKPRMLSEKDSVVPLGITSNLMRLHKLTQNTQIHTLSIVLVRSFVQAEIDVDNGC